MLFETGFFVVKSFDADFAATFEDAAFAGSFAFVDAFAFASDFADFFTAVFVPVFAALFAAGFAADFPLFFAPVLDAAFADFSGAFFAFADVFAFASDVADFFGFVVFAISLQYTTGRQKNQTGCRKAFLKNGNICELFQIISRFSLVIVCYLRYCVIMCAVSDGRMRGI